jgi:aryl-alcohol dehydrogenase-like predicted oxidoreductase
LTSNIIGATSVKNLEENISSIKIKLNKEILDDIEDVHLSDPNPCV